MHLTGVLKLLNQQPLNADRVNDSQRERTNKPLRGSRGPPDLRVQFLGLRSTCCSASDSIVRIGAACESSLPTPRA